MQKLMLSAAFAALLAAPALAQPGHDHHGGPGPAPGGAPHAAPQAAHAPNGNRGGSRHGPAMQARPQAAPATAAPRALARPQGNPGNGRHDANDRHDFHGNSAPANRPAAAPAFNNRPGNNNPGFNRGGARHNYSSFRNYHQNFRSSRRFHAGSYHRPSGWTNRRWTFGQILPALFWAQQYWLNDYMTYDLPPPPYGAVWVRYGNDALLIDRDSGEIITVEYDVFY